MTGGSTEGSLREGIGRLGGGGATLDWALPNLTARSAKNAHPMRQTTIATIDTVSARVIIVLSESSPLAIWPGTGLAGVAGRYGSEGDDSGGSGDGAGGSLTRRSCTIKMRPPLDDDGSTSLSTSAMALVEENASSTGLNAGSPCDTTIVFAESDVVVARVTFTPWLARP